MINFNKVITEYIKEYLSDDKWGDGDNDETYHASYLGMCPRQMLIAKADLSGPSRVRDGVFYLGKSFHMVIQRQVQHLADIEVPIEFKYKNFIIKGSADIVDEECVYDIKTKSSLRYIQSTIQNEHKIQTLIYMKALNKKRGSIIYVDKTNFTSKQIAFKYNSSIVERVLLKLEKFHPIYMKWKNNGMKISEIPFKKCKCMYCRYEVLKDG